MSQLVTADSLVRKPAPKSEMDLTEYDVIAVSSSGGKDSQAMLDYVVELAREQGVHDRVLVVHADLGRAEWEGTGELAREQAEAYGVPFVCVTRIGGTSKVNGKVYSKGETFGDLLDYAERRGAWPSSKQRWCTSEFKRGPILRAFTQFSREWRERTGETRACRILDCIGMRAQEGGEHGRRAKLPAFAERKRTRNQHVDTWLPIHQWKVEQVWETIRRSGVRHHRAYDLGMPRLSCAFCIFANKAALTVAGRANPQLLNEYVRVEEKIDHTFKSDLSLAEVRDAVERGEGTEAVEDWTM